MQPNDLHDGRQRLGAVIELHDRREVRTDLRPLWLTARSHAPCEQQGHGIGNRLAAQADGDLAGRDRRPRSRLAMTAGKSIAALPHLRDGDELTRRFGVRRPAVFLDYDGTLTPIVDRPEDAVISVSLRAAVRGLARRCPVCVVSARDRGVVRSRWGSRI